MKRFLLVLWLGLVGTPAARADFESLPYSWYTLPEERLSAELRDVVVDEYNEVLSPSTIASLERLFNVNRQAFDRMEDRIAESPLDRRDRKWSLAACIFDLGVSGSGNIGMLVAKADATGALYWRPRQTRGTDDLPSQDAEVDLSLSTDETREEIKAKLEPIVAAVIATGEVTDKETLRKNLERTVLGYHEVMQHLPHAPGSQWKVSRLRLDFSVDVSGKVNPVTTVGGGVKLRFEWEPTSRGTPFASNERPPEIGENLKKLIANLSHELEQIPYDGLSVSHFDLKQLKIGIGIFGEGNVGVVKLGASLFGFLYFTRTAEAAKALPSVSSGGPIPLIDYTSNAQYRHWAASHGVPFHTYRDRGSDVTVYSVVGEKLRQGLVKAVRMGTKLVEIGDKHQGKWELYQLKSEFALSLSGTVSLVKLGATASIELVFQKVATKEEGI